MGPSEEGEPSQAMPEESQLRLVPEGTPSPRSPAAAGPGEVEALVGELGSLKLDDGESRGGGGDELVSAVEVGNGGDATEGEGEGRGGLVSPAPPYVSGEDSASGEKGTEESDAERAWKGQQEWMEENEASKEGGGIQEDGNGAQQEKGMEGKSGKLSYPQRTGEPDCTYYLKTGYCAFGANCKFNHPHREKRIHVVRSTDAPEKSQVKEKEREEYSGSVGQKQCKYYLTKEGCKFGSNCRYRHGRESSESGLELNILGLPMRQGEKECIFYLRTGSCKYGTNCRFNHPNPIAVGEQAPVSGYHDNGSSRQHASGVSQVPGTAWSMQNCSNQSVSFVDTSPSGVPAMLLPHQLHQNPEWNGYQAPPNALYPLEGNQKYPSVQTMYKPMTNVNGHSGQCQMQTEEYPQRPGQPECQFYMENGSCRYKSSCRFHHPKDRLAGSQMCLLSPMGLPLRPDQPVCVYFSRYGICKFGPNCRFNHPMDHASSRVHSQTAVIP